MGFEKVGLEAVLEGVPAFEANAAKMNRAVGNVTKEVTNARKPFTGLTDAAKVMQTGMVGAAAGVGVLVGAYKAVIAPTVAYAKQVRDLGRTIGTSADETSRLIQVADDYKISTESLTTALTLAVKNGFVPSVENLAKLADEYNSIQDPLERAAILTEKFGRNWTVLAPLLEAGGDAIRAQSAAIADNLVLTEEQVQAARDWEIALDTIEDAVKGAGIAIGNDLIPYLVKAATAFELVVTWNDKLINALDQHAEEVEKSGASYEDYATELRRAAAAAGLVVTAEGNLIRIIGSGRERRWELVQANYLLTESERAGAAATAEWVAQNEGRGAVMRGLAAATLEAAENAKRAEDELSASRLAAEQGIKTAAIQAATEALTAYGGATWEVALLEAQLQAIGDKDAATRRAVTEAMNELVAQEQAGIITRAELLTTTQLLIEGEITAEDITGNLAGAFGRADTEARKAAGGAAALTSELNAIPREIDVFINVHTPEGGYRQHGGPVFPGVSYSVAEVGSELFAGVSGLTELLSGPTFRPREAGFVLPANLTRDLISPLMIAARSGRGSTSTTYGPTIHQTVNNHNALTQAMFESAFQRMLGG